MSVQYAIHGSSEYTPISDPRALSALISEMLSMYNLAATEEDYNAVIRAIEFGDAYTLCTLSLNVCAQT